MDLGSSIKTTLSDLFNAKSTLDLDQLTQSAWVRGEADIEAKILYFEMLSRPWEDSPSTLSSNKKGKRKASISSSDDEPTTKRRKRSAPRPPIAIDSDAGIEEGGDPSYFE